MAAFSMVSLALLQSTVAQTVIQKNVPAAAADVSVSAPLAAAFPPNVRVARDPPERAGAVVGTDISVQILGRRTVFNLVLTQAVEAQVFLQPTPYRIVIDLPEVEFRLPTATRGAGQGLIAGYRYGLVGAGRSRVVIDTVGPVRVQRSGTVPQGAGAILQIEIEATSAADFAASVNAAQEAPTAVSAPPVAAQAGKLRPSNAKFVVMIDPGHGGIDAGAIGGNQTLEKDIVLAVARQLKSALDARNKYDVRMTRSADTFVKLDQRIALSEAANANLFISLHADSVGDAALARAVHGATVYTLSDQASNMAAQALAEKENAADAAAGVAGADDAESGQINSILADLVKRETHTFSADFQQLLLERMRPGNMLARDPARSAAFKVLRQVRTPTVLIELGFITHQADAEQMQLAEWQKRVAASIASAVDTYVKKRGTQGH